MFCGRKMEEALNGLGIHTIGEIAGTKQEFLRARLGKAGAQLYEYANGQDSDPVRDYRDIREVKSIGNSVTFRRDLCGLEDITRGVAAIADSVASRMRRHGLKCWVVQVGIKDPNLRIITRQKTLKVPTHLAKELSAAAMELIGQCWNPGAPIRMLSISGSTLVPQDAPLEQLCFFSADSGEKGRVRQEKLECALDTIREKFGSAAVVSCSMLNEDLGLDGLHRK